MMYVYVGVQRSCGACQMVMHTQLMRDTRDTRDAMSMMYIVPYAYPSLDIFSCHGERERDLGGDASSRGCQQQGMQAARGFRLTVE